MEHRRFGKLTFKINARGAKDAMQLALDHACDQVFTRSHDLDDICQEDAVLFEGGDFCRPGGYEVDVIRIGYANTPQSGEYDSHYFISGCSSQGPLYPSPDFQQASYEELQAEIDGLALEEAVGRSPALPKPRF